MTYRFFFVIVIAIVLLLGCIGPSQASQTDKERPFIDLIDLLLMYIPPDPRISSSWFTGAWPDSPIYWHTRGIRWVEELQTHIRDGEVVVTIDGKPAYVGTQNSMPVLWKIRLNGPRAGIYGVELRSPNGVFIDLEQEMDRRQLVYELQRTCPKGEANKGKRLYKIGSPTKQAAWLYYEWGCSQDGCGVKLKLFPGAIKMPDEASELVPETCGED